MSDIVDLKLNEENWDISVTGQNIDTVSGIEAIRQNYRQRLNMFRGEYPYDLTKGVPYHDEFFKKRFNPIVVDTILKNTIIDTPGTLELTKFNLSFSDSTRELSLIFKTICTEGIVDYSGTLPL